MPWSDSPPVRASLRPRWRWSAFLLAAMPGVFLFAPAVMATLRGGTGVDADQFLRMLVLTPIGLLLTGLYLLLVRRSQSAVTFALWGLFAGALTGPLGLAVLAALTID